MLQSLWNVAAAFCVHEEPAQIQQSYHFGHHQNTLCSSEMSHSDLPHEPSKQLKSASDDLQIGEDHQDHLPSMIHLIVQDQHTVEVSPNLDLPYIPKFDWKNHYQAPDLFLKNPPPEYAPLMVG